MMYVMITKAVMIKIMICETYKMITIKITVAIMTNIMITMINVAVMINVTNYDKRNLLTN